MNNCIGNIRIVIQSEGKEILKKGISLITGYFYIVSHSNSINTEHLQCAKQNGSYFEVMVFKNIYNSSSEKTISYKAL